MASSSLERFQIKNIFKPHLEMLQLNRSTGFICLCVFYLCCCLWQRSDWLNQFWTIGRVMSLHPGAQEHRGFLPVQSIWSEQLPLPVSVQCSAMQCSLFDQNNWRRPAWFSTIKTVHDGFGRSKFVEIDCVDPFQAPCIRRTGICATYILQGKR